ncbi:MAG: AsmA family protein [Gammaproteobacteria bacterium]|nr:AsmA family protein [Gammaproteobacteria bacterium]
MKKVFKIFAWGFGGLLLLLVGVIVVFALNFDPNALRDDITRVVEKETGRQLTIEGDLDVTFFPWLGFEAGRTTISNASGFSEPVMASFEAASASVKLMPLLRRQIELSTVTLDGMQLELEIKADGSTNWDDLLALAEEDPDEASDPAKPGFASQSLGGIRLTNARVNYIDAESGSDYRLRDLNLESSELLPGEPFSLEANAELESRSLEITGPVEFAGELRIDDDAVVWIKQPSMSITASGEGVPGDSLTIDLQAPAMNLVDSKLTIDTPELKIAGSGPGEPYKTIAAQIEGKSLTADSSNVLMNKPVMNLALTGSSETWSAMTADMQGASFGLVDFDRIDLPAMEVIGEIKGPELPGGRVDLTMTGERLQGSIEYQNIAIDVVRGNVLDLAIFSKKVKVSKFIDDPTIEAPIEVSQFAPRALLKKLEFEDFVTADPAALSSAKFSGEAYYGSAAMGARNLKGTLDQTAFSGSLKLMESGETQFQLVADDINLDRYRAPAEDAQAAGDAVAVADIEIPAEELKTLALDGTLKIGKMQLIGLKSTNVSVGIKAAQGKIRVNPASAQLYGGTYQGDVRLDVDGNLPTLSLNERLENVQFGPFSKDLFDSERLSGTLNGRITAIGSGMSSNAITASTNGDAVFKFSDGAYEGTDIWYQVRRARALIKQEPQPAEPAEKRTRFADLSGTAKISNGVMQSDDLRMVLPFMRVKGQGSVQLLSQEIDFRFQGDVVDRPELDAGEDELVGFTIPIKVTGTAAQPSVGVDMGGYLAALAKRKLLEKLGVGGNSNAANAPETPAEAVEQKKEELKDSIEDKLKDKLKGLFGDSDGG